MNPINQRNLKIRLIFALVIGASLLLALNGGFAAVSATIHGDAAPENFTLNNPFTQDSVSSHVYSVAQSESYHISFEKQTVGEVTSSSERQDLYVDNINKQAYMITQTEDGVEEMYETESHVFTKDTDGSITVESTENSSPLLRNQLVMGESIGLPNFYPFQFIHDPSSESEYGYKLTKVNSFTNQDSSTISSAEGSISVDSNRISSATVAIFGQKSTGLTQTSYHYNTTIDIDFPETPTWVVEEKEQMENES